MRFDLTDLQLVVGVHDSGTLTAGAEATGLTLASASERLRGLEARLGVELFARGSRGMAPTPAGGALLGHARRVLAQVEDLRRELGEHRAGTIGRVRLRGNTAACRELLPDALAGFLPGHPGTSVMLAEARSEDIARALAAGEAELGIVSDAVDDGGLERQPLRPDPLALVVPADHALARHASLAFADALGRPFVGLAEGSALQEHVDAQARRLGVVGVDYRLRVQELDAVCAMVARGIGVGVVPLHVARRWEARGSCGTRHPGASNAGRHANAAGQVRVVRLTDGWTRRRLVLVARSFGELAPAGRRLAQHLRATLAAPGGLEA